MAVKTRFLMQELNEKDSWLYRSLSQAILDIDKAKYEKMIKTALLLYLTNPLAYGIIELITDFVVGANEFKIEIKNDDEIFANEFYDYLDFTFTANNLWDMRELYKELLITGELHLPVSFNDEKPSIGFIPSVLLSRIEIDPLDQRKIKNLVYFIQGSELHFTPISRLIKRQNKGIVYDYEGNLFWFRINKVLSLLRGYSELIQALDWLDALDQLLFNSLETSALKNTFFLYLKLTGASETEIKEKEQIYREAPLKPGAIIVGNDKMEWETIKNDVSIEGLNDIARTYKNYILAAKRLPEMWFAEGGYTNLATAREMSTPALKMFQSKQLEFKNLLFDLIDYIMYHYCLTNNAMDKFYNTEIIISLVSLERPEVKDYASAVASFINAIATAYEYRFMDKENAIKVIELIFNKLGFDVDLSKALEENQTIEEAMIDLQNKVMQALNDK